MATNSNRSLGLLLLAVLLALVIAVGASYGVVVSQNSKSTVIGPATVYGPGSVQAP